MIKHRVVIDTNIIVSGLLKPTSLIADFITNLDVFCFPLISQETYDEMERVLLKFQHKKIISSNSINDFILEYGSILDWIPIIERVRECSDPKDNKFLELAVNGNAKYIISGDEDLLRMNPFRGIEILKVSEFIGYLLNAKTSKL